MLHGELLLFWLLGLAMISVAAFAWFSPQAKLRRRRRKSHSPVVAKVSRPMVRFSVRTPKK